MVIISSSLTTNVSPLRPRRWSTHLLFVTFSAIIVVEMVTSIRFDLSIFFNARWNLNTIQYYDYGFSSWVFIKQANFGWQLFAVLVLCNHCVIIGHQTVRAHIHNILSNVNGARLQFHACGMRRVTRLGVVPDRSSPDSNLIGWSDRYNTLANMLRHVYNQMINVFHNDSLVLVNVVAYGILCTVFFC